MLSILINGICGQMGRAVYAACIASNGAFSPAAGVDRNAGSTSDFACPVYATLSEVSEPVDAIIDFSVPASLPELVRFAQRRMLPLIVGTTGLSERDLRLIQTVSERIPIFQTGNMSLGVNLQLALAKTATATLGPDFDVEIIEKHHRKKVDAPSGTALMLADCVASQRTDGLDYVYGRHEKSKRRSDDELGIHSIRGGTLAGEHEVLFIGNDEVLEISHKAYSKQVFVRGALRAARFLQGKKRGLYNMQNVVAEHDIASHIYPLEEQAVVTLSGIACSMVERAFAQIAKHGVNVDMIAMTVGDENAVSVGFSCANGQLDDALAALRPFSAECPSLTLYAHSEVVKLTVEGSGMALHHGVAARLLLVLSNAGVHARLITTSETKIEVCVDAIDATRAIEELREKFLSDLA